MGFFRKAAQLALSTLAIILLTGAGFGQYERIDCIGPDDQLPVYRLRVDFQEGAGHASVVIVAPGYALTASHAVNGHPTTISVLTPEGPRAASVVASDPINDLALLAVDTTGISPLAFFRDDLKPNRRVWLAGFPGDAGTSFSGPILGVLGGHLKIGAPVFPGMSGGAVIACEKGVPYLAGTIVSFNYRISRTWTEITPEQKQIFERVVNDGTSNAPGGMMLVWFTEFAIDMHKINNKREQEQE